MQKYFIFIINRKDAICKKIMIGFKISFIKICSFNSAFSFFDWNHHCQSCKHKGKTEKCLHCMSSRPLRGHGGFSFTTHLSVHENSYIVSIKEMGTIPKEMPLRSYHRWSLNCHPASWVNNLRT